MFLIRHAAVQKALKMVIEYEAGLIFYLQRSKPSEGPATVKPPVLPEPGRLKNAAAGCAAPED
jgi:hypothetical protein